MIANSVEEAWIIRKSVALAIKAKALAPAEEEMAERIVRELDDTWGE